MISLLGLGRAARIVERNAVAYRRAWFVVLSVLAEPVLYLLSIGIGVGELVGELPGPDGPVSYETFVAPGMMAAVAMNGAVIETTFNFFFRFKYMRSYDAALATPLTPRDVAVGELTTALLRGAFYAAAFLTTMALMGLVESWWGILAVPGALLIGFGFAGVGLAATTWMRSFVDFDYINLALVPLFLFSATFFPLDRYPDLIQWVVRATPLYQGVAIERSLMLGDIPWALLGHAAY
ncbi:MAG TPA: ABC transporter permease, partial [Acidimicrobiia bacterium]|nr:ABC transporter permease [Acidimicrobiia bacterium]